MKNTLLLVLCILFCSVLLAQDKKSKTKKDEKSIVTQRKVYGELGVNITNAISAGGFRFTERLDKSDPFFAHFKIVAYRFGIRGGYGGAFYSDKELGDVIGEIRSEQSHIARLGLDYQIPIDKRWRMYFGGDVIMGTATESRVRLDNAILIREDFNRKTTGIGGVYGLQFHINKHISLQTEATFYVTNTKQERITSYPNLPGEPNGTTNSTLQRFPVGVPRSLYVIFRL